MCRPGKSHKSRNHRRTARGETGRTMPVVAVSGKRRRSGVPTILERTADASGDAIPGLLESRDGVNIFPGRGGSLSVREALRARSSRPDLARGCGPGSAHSRDLCRPIAAVRPSSGLLLHRPRQHPRADPTPRPGSYLPLFRVRKIRVRRANLAVRSASPRSTARLQAVGQRGATGLGPRPGRVLAR